MKQDRNANKCGDDVLPDVRPMSVRRRKESVGLLHIIVGIACCEAAEAAETSPQTSGPGCDTLTPDQTAQFNVYQCRAIQQLCFASMKPKAFSGFTAECVAGFDGNAIQGITANQVGYSIARVGDVMWWCGVVWWDILWCSHHNIRSYHIIVMV